MANQQDIQVNMRFNADSTSAKTQLQALQQSLNNLTTSMASKPLPIQQELQAAQRDAIKLKTALSQAMNINTGTLDLSKFNSSLNSMGTNLTKIKASFSSLGAEGQQSFMQLAQSIAMAEIPSKRLSNTLLDMGKTLKNTIKWQLSSSMIHGFMSAVQKSYNYAQNLNGSLNDIRIVTGLSADEMDKFAVSANKAAKALSASTLDYTNAALIYYQQGLDSQQVQERTDITLKMANVSRQSAAEVSDQMTAVWNNFYDGSQSLEHFADAMVKLGADTASSSDEIAEGLEKFAAIGDTVGLSFDNAAAALATVTATTRQSADVVGTALILRA